MKALKTRLITVLQARQPARRSVEFNTAPQSAERG
jgi:hypothetical protein